MTVFGTITFLQPWALAALALLPIIYWLLRATPPKPQTRKFAPFNLLRDLISNREETWRTPWWLIALRLALAALVILAVARPLLTSEQDAAKSATGPLLIVIDNDWSSAPSWPERMEVLGQTLASAKQAGRSVAIALTVPQVQPRPITLVSALDAERFAATLKPRGLEADYKALLARLNAKFTTGDKPAVIWFANGLTGKDKAATDFETGLKRMAGGNLTIFTPDDKKLPFVIGPPASKAGKITVPVLRPAGVEQQGLTINVAARNGRVLAATPVTFKDASTRTDVTIDLPLALRNEAAALRLSGPQHAAGLHLFDDRWRRKSVGLVTSNKTGDAQPLLSPLYYVTRAINTSAEITRHTPANLDKAFKSGLSMLVLADVGQLPPQTLDAIVKWVASGGVLLRFAGPRLASASGRRLDDNPLVPVPLRHGGRALGSALSWQEPQKLAPFAEGTPLSGLKVDPAIAVRRQVLAEPSPDLSNHVWATLQDGTPLITARRHNQGLVVLVHVTANSDWSNLPLTGLFVEILTRILDLAPAVTTAVTTAKTKTVNAFADPFVPQVIISGTAQLVPPPANARPIPAPDIDKATVSLQYPPGLYARAANVRALNLKPGVDSIQKAAFSTATRPYAQAPRTDLTGWLLTAAFLLLLADTVVAFWIMGSLKRLRAAATPAAIMAIAAGTFLLALSQSPASAQSDPKFARALEALSVTRLAYVKTGNQDVDAVSHQGLVGLNTALRQRTAVEPGSPHGIDLEKDDIVFYPLLYWPVLENAKPPSAKVLAKLTRFMTKGGTIFFDTQDQGASLNTLLGNPSPKTRALRRILEKFDIPALEPVPPRHVLTRAFYLLQRFPGRWNNGELWVEASTTDKSNTDGVSSIIIGSNNYAAAWAISATGEPVYATVPGTDRQREFAYRTGINVVMYTLTGNYKADQVHVPALLQRLGQ